MDPVGMIISLIQVVSGIPAVGKPLAMILGAMAGLSAVVSALVGMWHAIVKMIDALASLPGLSGLKPLAEKMKADSVVVDDKSSKALVLINRLSVVPMPQQKPPQV